jgi:multidrug efflux pump subunit AcrB
MNDGHSQLDLDAAEQDERELQIAVSGAQRLLHDDILQQFLSEMRKVGEQYAVYGTTSEQRELNRVKVMAIDELRGHLQAMAKVNQDRLDDDERAKALE